MRMKSNRKRGRSEGMGRWGGCAVWNGKGGRGVPWAGRQAGRKRIGRKSDPILCPFLPWVHCPPPRPCCWLPHTQQTTSRPHSAQPHDHKHGKTSLPHTQQPTSQTHTQQVISLPLTQQKTTTPTQQKISLPHTQRKTSLPTQQTTSTPHTHSSYQTRTPKAHQKINGLAVLVLAEQKINASGSLQHYNITLSYHKHAHPPHSHTQNQRR